ncbi:MAG TPA: hypothetical protein PKK43_05085 [Spirochaetota bacterium]|nr:hypothetical protein [Spirochaetota bacterium]
MIRIIMRLFNESREMPLPIRLISYFNILNLFAVLIYSIVNFILMLGDVGLTRYALLSILFPVVACTVAVMILLFNVKLLSGGVIALYAMIGLSAMQVISFGARITGVNYNACVLTPYLTVNLSGYTFIRLNIIPLIIIGYLCVKRKMICGPVKPEVKNDGTDHSDDGV